jgi:hypothetical protein
LSRDPRAQLRRFDERQQRGDVLVRDSATLTGDSEPNPSPLATRAVATTGTPIAMHSSTLFCTRLN